MVTLGWMRREPPLAVCGVVASGQSVSAYAMVLADRLGDFEDLRVAVDETYLVAMSEAGDLPWTDGLIWLGNDGGLLCPTHLIPTLPSSLVAEAISQGNRSNRLLVAAPGFAFAGPMPARGPSASMLRAVGAAHGVRS